METVLTKVDQILTASAQKWSEKTAVFGADGRSCSYEQLEAAANSVAELLSTSRVSSG
jgi:non-ribosomal peptide synthetase component E (peptide arylation enzyme)